MKRILKFTTLCMLLGIASSVSAKNLDRGTWVIGGGLDLGVGSAETEIGSSNATTDTLTLDTGIVYYPGQNLGYALLIEYADSETSDTVGVSSATDVLAGLGLVYNISQGYESALRFTGAYLAGTSERVTTSLTTENDVTKYLVALDYVSFLSDQVSFDIGVEYSQRVIDLGSFDSETTSTTFRAGFSVYFSPY